MFSHFLFKNFLFCYFVISLISPFLYLEVSEAYIGLSPIAFGLINWISTRAAKVRYGSNILLNSILHQGLELVWMTMASNDFIYRYICENGKNRGSLAFYQAYLVVVDQITPKRTHMTPLKFVICLFPKLNLVVQINFFNDPKP